MSNSEERRLYKAAQKRARLRNGIPVLSVGQLNLKTGQNKYFNTVQNGHTTIMIIKTPSGQRNAVIGSIGGYSPIMNPEVTKEYHDDQTLRPKFAGKYEQHFDVITMEDLAKMRQTLGETSICAYVLK